MFVGVNYGGSKGPAWQTPRVPTELYDVQQTWGCGDSYGWDFGFGFYPSRSGGHWRGSTGGHSRGALDLAQFAQNEVSVVRWFLLGDGLSYGRIDVDFLLTSDPIAGVRRTFHPPSLLDRARPDMGKILDDFVHLLGLVRSTGGGQVKIIPVVCDFQLAKVEGRLS